jgi:hypothetical protein
MWPVPRVLREDVIEDYDMYLVGGWDCDNGSLDGELASLEQVSSSKIFRKANRIRNLTGLCLVSDAL